MSRTLNELIDVCKEKFKNDDDYKQIVDVLEDYKKLIFGNYFIKELDQVKDIKPIKNMERYKLVVENPLDAFILDTKENMIVTLCNTKRPDLEFDKLKELIEKANRCGTTIELLKDVLLSEDAAWENNNEGHDWKECVENIRGFLSSQI